MGVRAVFLVGFMASGKSSVGQQLARRIGWDFVDLDARIESREARVFLRFSETGESPDFGQWKRLRFES
jgi:shikimate kinase